MRRKGVPMGKKRRQYTHEFKLDAVRLVVEQGRGVTEAARGLGIDRGLLQTWKKKFIKEGLVSVPEGATRTDEAEELRRLRKENARLRQERDILKKRRPTSRTTRTEIPVHRGPPGDLRGRPDVQSLESLPERILRMGSPW